MTNRLKEMIKLRSVRHKLMAASIVCILVPAFITLLLYNALTQQAVRRQAVANAQDSLQLVHDSVANLMKSMLNVANYIQVNSSMNTYFKLIDAGQTGESDSYAQFTEKKYVLDQLDSLTVLGEKSYVTVLLTNGKYFTNYSVEDFDPLSLRQEPWFGQLQTLQGFQSYWAGSEPTAFRLDKLNHAYQISVGRTLRKDNGIYGYIVVTFFEDEISSIFSKLNAGQELMLVDGQGKIVSDSDEARVGLQAPLDPKADAAGGASAIRAIGGRKFLLVQRPIAFNDWTLVLEQPYKDAIVNITAIFNRVFVFQAVSFVGFLLLLLALLRAFTKPLVRLGKITTAVQRGNLAVRSGIRGSDEIGRLGFLFDQMLERVQEMIAEVSVTQARKRKAELRMLQAQIHPHFLFNVLNSIRMKVLRRGDPDSAKMISSLSKLLRMTISKEEDEITLHEELDLLTSYVELMNLRHKEAAVLTLDVASEAFLMKVPRFFLQPVVENALIHGLKQRAGAVVVRAEPNRLFLLLTVADDGGGMTPEALAALRRKLRTAEPPPDGREEAGERGSFSGLGLRNVVERMRMVFGDGFRMEVDSEPGNGTVIRMFIPRKEEERDV